jgi:hypothetical protein
MRLDPRQKTRRSSRRSRVIQRNVPRAAGAGAIVELHA